MKKIALAFITLLWLPLSAQADEITEMASVVTPGLYDPRHISWTAVDGITCLFCPKSLSAGTHSIGSGKKVMQCDFVGGHIYSIEAAGCIDKGRRMDFEGAENYWAKFDAEEIKKANEELARDKQLKEESEAVKYKADKLALLNAQSKLDVEAVISSLTLRMCEDPDNLLGQAKQKLAPYLQAENAQQEAKTAVDLASLKKENEEAAAHQAKEQQQIASFRKLLQEGDETSCGLVIEKKAKLVKIQIKSSNTEQWVRLDEVYPTGQICSLTANTLKPSNDVNAASVGQKICGAFKFDSTWAGEISHKLAKVTGFIENSSGSKIQVRISGIQTDGRNIDRIDGDVVFATGALIWAESSQWRACN